MKSILTIILSLLLLPQISLAEERNVKFSIYMPQVAKRGSGDYKHIDNLQYAYGDKVIPLIVKKSRQTLAYPYRGGSQLTLFSQTKNNQGKEERTPLVSTSIPAKAVYGVLILLPKNDGSYKCAAQWFDNQDLKGKAVVYNVSSQDIQLRLKGKKPVMVGKGKRKFLPCSTNKVYEGLATDGFIARKTKKGVLLQNIFKKMFKLQKGNCQFILITEPHKFAFETFALEAKGVNNRVALAALQKHLPGYMKEKTKQL